MNEEVLTPFNLERFETEIKEKLEQFKKAHKEWFWAEGKDKEPLRENSQKMYNGVLDLCAAAYLESNEDTYVLRYLIDLIELKHTEDDNEISPFTPKEQAQILADFMRKVSEKKNTKRAEIEKTLEEK